MIEGEKLIFLSGRMVGRGKLEAIGRHVPASRNSNLKRLQLNVPSIKISTIAIDF
jgi:hypothetical protein